MNLAIHGRNVTVTSRIQSYVERKIGRLDRYLPDITEVRVDLGTEKSRTMGDQMIAQVTVRHSRGIILRAEERTSDIFAAIDEVIDKLYRQIERYKGKRRRRNDSMEDFAGFETAIEIPDTELEPQRVIRRKQFSLDPMLEEEAIEQMELLAHDFFVFVNATTGGVNVLYRRKDGNLGLLEPEVK